jgi:hypothetical protein
MSTGSKLQALCEPRRRTIAPNPPMHKARERQRPIRGTTHLQHTVHTHATVRRVHEWRGECLCEGWPSHSAPSTLAAPVTASSAGESGSRIEPYTFCNRARSRSAEISRPAQRQTARPDGLEPRRREVSREGM